MNELGTRSEIDHAPIAGPARCGRPTKAGTPCKNQLAHGFHVACRSHGTASERELADAQWEAYWAGHRDAQKSVDNGHQLQIKHLEGLIAELRQQLDTAHRRFTIGNDQLVEIDGYSYRWSGEPLIVGDRVLLPANWLSEIKYGPGPFVGTVTALGSTYTGALSAVIRRAGDGE